MTKEEFKDSISYLGIAYNREFTKKELELYYDFLKDYNDETLVKAIKNIIKKSKFLPKINELIDECNNCKQNIKYEVVEFMLKSGYFKKGDYGELDFEQELRNYEKTKKFINENNVPEWLKQDINYYYKLMKQDRLENNIKLIGGDK